MCARRNSRQNEAHDVGMADKKRPESDDDPPRRVIGTPTPEERQAAEDLVRASRTRHIIGAEDPSELTDDKLRDELADLAPRLQASEVLGKDFRDVDDRDAQGVIDDARNFKLKELFDLPTLGPMDRMIIQQRERDPSTHSNPVETQHLEDIIAGKPLHDDGSGAVRQPTESASGSGDDDKNKDDDHSGEGDGQHHSPGTGADDDPAAGTPPPDDDPDDDQPAEDKNDAPDPDPNVPNSPDDKVAPIEHTEDADTGVTYYRPDGSMYVKYDDGTTKELDDTYHDDDDTPNDDDNKEDTDEDDEDELPPGDGDGDFHETGRAAIEHRPNLTFARPDDGDVDPNDTNFGAGQITEEARPVPGVVDPVGPEQEFGASHDGAVPVALDDGRTDPLQDDDTLGELGPEQHPFDDQPGLEEPAEADDDGSVTFHLPPPLAQDVELDDHNPDLAVHDLD